MMKSWSFILAIVCLNFIFTYGQLRFQQVNTELTTQTSETHHEEDEEFKKIFKSVEDLINTRIDPCKNFYQFVCSGHPKRTRYAFDYAYEETDRRLISKYEQEEPLESENKMSIIKHSRNLYKSCKKTKNEKGFNDFILRDLDAIGGWPALKGDLWNPSAFDWKRSVFKSGNQNIWTNYLFNIKLVDEVNIKLKIEPVVYDHKTALEFAARLGGNNSVDKEELDKVNEFSKTFLKRFSAQLPISEQYPRTLSVEDLIKKYPYYPWLEYVRYIDSNIQLFDILTVPIFIDNLFSLLHNADQRMLANIVAWNRVASLDKYFAKFNRIKDCYEIIFEVLDSAPSFLYLHEFILDNKTKQASQFSKPISTRIRQQFIEMLRKEDWISETTYSIEKLEKISYQFGYPTDPLLDNLLNEYYNNIQSNHSNFYDALTSITEFHKRLRSDKKFLGNWPALKEYFHEVRNLPQAKYLEKSNSIIVKLGLLQRQYLDSNQPMWMNFAMFGVIIAHEFGKSLAPNLIQLNVTGKINGSGGYIGYHKKSRCLNDMWRDIVKDDESQRMRYQLPTTDGDITEYLGLKATYLAYKSLSVNENSRTLHGKEYSPDQLFWIYATNQFCRTDYPLFLNSEKVTVLASLSNIDGFSRDFNCPENSEMNNHEKCSSI